MSRGASAAARDVDVKEKARSRANGYAKTGHAVYTDVDLSATTTPSKLDANYMLCADLAYFRCILSPLVNSVCHLD